MSNEDIKLIQYAEVLLVHLGYDTDTPVFKDTARRYANRLKQYQDRPEVPPGTVAGMGAREDSTGTAIYISPIPFTAMCATHFMPMHGAVGVAYAPDQLIPEVSSVVRAVEFYTQRFIVQQTATFALMEELTAAVHPGGAAVIIKARHSCELDPVITTECVTGSIDSSIVNSLRTQLERWIS